MQPDNRILVGILIAVTVLGMLFGGSISSSLLFGLIAILSAVEIDRATSAFTTPRIFSHILAAVLPTLLLLYYPLHTSSLKILTGISLAFNVYLALDLFFNLRFPYKRMSVSFTTLYIGLPIGLTIAALMHSDLPLSRYIIQIIFLIWTCDTMAYFVGRAIGKNKLFPSVSPKKTIEGSLGAGVCALLVSILIAYFSEQNYGFWVILALIVWIGSTIGDLVESKFKRVVDIKDSGTLLKGHGGILDRFDSLIYIIPFVFAYFYYQLW